MTARLPDWETRLAVYLASSLERAASGEKNFCALFAAGAVEAVTGENPAASFRGRYSQVAEALEETIDGLFPQKPAAFAGRGDLAWHDGAVGVVIGGEAIFVAHYEETEAPTFTRVPRHEWQKVWAVGG